MALPFLSVFRAPAVHRRDVFLYLFAVVFNWFHGRLWRLQPSGATGANPGLLGSGWYSRMLRSSMIEVLHQDFYPHRAGQRAGPNPRTAASRAAECRAAANSG